MDEYTENRFGYLRKLTDDEKLRMIEELQLDNQFMQKEIDDKSVSGEKKSEFYNDIHFNEEKIEYLNSILNEMQR